MGSGASSVSSELPGTELRLPATGLRFGVPQLTSLNSYVDNLYEQRHRGRMSTEMETSVENLVQKIVDGAGQRDPRFRCCHLIALHREKKMKSRSLEYLVTLDSLPTLNAGNEECYLQEGPPGYAKIRLTGRQADKWQEFLTPNGYLCRDKVVERWVELIARCTHARGGSGGSRALSARAATHAQPYHYCYVERVSQTRSMPEQRLAIVEGAACVMVRVGVGEAKLVLGVRAAGVPRGSYIFSVPLTHPMALIHYKAAQTGMYAVAVGPPSSIVCPDRTAAWQVRTPALEASLDVHCSQDSTVGRIAGALNVLVDRMRDGVVQGSLRVISRHMVWSVLHRRLLRSGLSSQCSLRGPLALHASHHLLLIIDTLISVCDRRHPAGLLFDLDRGCCARRGVRAADAEWVSDANCLRNYLNHLHADCARAQEIAPTVSESLEMMLFRRWGNLIKESRSTAGNTFSRRQLRYVWRLAHELISCKKAAVEENHNTLKANLIQATSCDQEPVEDLIHILAIMLDQARDQYLLTNYQQTRNLEIDKDISNYRSKKWNKLKDYYDASSACLIDAVRRDPDLRNEDLLDEVVVMKNIINWLVKGAKDDKKYLGPVLKPYLEGLMMSSLEYCWFIEEFDGKKCDDEYVGLKEYCLKVHEGGLDPCLGLMNASKKLTWAKTLVDFVDRSKRCDLRIVFPTGDGMAVSFPLKLPSRREHSAVRALTLNRRDKADAKLRLARRSVMTAFNTALVGDRWPKEDNVLRSASSEEILDSVKTGNYWRNDTKPDIISSTSSNQELTTDARKTRTKSRRQRPMTAYGFPEISITNEMDSKTMRKKYHTLRNLVYSDSIESIKEIKERPKSAGSSLRSKALSRPSMLETLDFINGVRDALCVDESGTSDAEELSSSPENDWLMCHMAPLNVLARMSSGDQLHLFPGSLIVALLHRGKFTILQELCSLLGDSSEGALFALHRLARAARSKSSDRAADSWKLPEATCTPAETSQRYRPRPLDYFSGDDTPQPPPLPRRSGTLQAVQAQEKRYSDYLPPKRLQELENNIKDLEIMNSKLNHAQNSIRNSNTSLFNESYTGILTPIINEKKVRDKFATKRSKSLGRSFSSRRLGLEMTRYNLTLGYRSGKRTNDVMTAIAGTTGETGVDGKSNYFQKYSSAASVVGDSYRASRITID